MVTTGPESASDYGKLLENELKKNFGEYYDAIVNFSNSDYQKLGEWFFDKKRELIGYDGDISASILSGYEYVPSTAPRPFVIFALPIKVIICLSKK